MASLINCLEKKKIKEKRKIKTAIYLKSNRCASSRPALSLCTCVCDTDTISDVRCMMGEPVLSRGTRGVTESNDGKRPLRKVPPKLNHRNAIFKKKKCTDDVLAWIVAKKWSETLIMSK